MLAKVMVVLLVALAACGGDEGQLVAPCTPVTTTSTNTSQKPVIEIPEDTEPPETLQSCDVVEGSGDAAATGDEVLVQYAGVAWSTGTEFDASWNRPGEPFSFQLGGGLVIQGWDLGLIGAKEGGRRELIIPPHQAYGPNGRPPTIGPNETLVFVIDVVQVGGPPRP